MRIPPAGPLRPSTLLLDLPCCPRRCVVAMSTTTSDSDMAERPVEAFVWVWLPGSTEPVVAGRLTDRGSVITFTYGRSFLERSDAMALYLPELPLRRGEVAPLSGEIAGCIADAGPDAWGRRVIESQCVGNTTDLGTLAYLLASGSNRTGALDFQQSAVEYTPRGHDVGATGGACRGCRAG